MNSEERSKSSFIRLGAEICLAGFFLIALLSPVWAQARGDWKQTNDAGGKNHKDSSPAATESE